MNVYRRLFKSAFGVFIGIITIFCLIWFGTSLTLSGISELNSYPVEILFLGLFLLLVPPGYLILMWFFAGRDLRFKSQNIYFEDPMSPTETVPIIDNHHLPMVYRPIMKLSPSEIGTINDQKVDIEDVIAEMIELVNLGYLDLKKIEDDFILTKKEKDTSKLASHQKYLLTSLFSKHVINISNSIAKNIFQSGKSVSDIPEKDFIFISALKNNFYLYLNGFRDRLYDTLIQKGILDSNPDYIRFQRFKWMNSFFLGLNLVFLRTGNLLLMGLSIYSSALTNLLIVFLPRRTAIGHSYYQQIKGMKFYLKKGEWRYKFSQENYLIDSILPIAIVLGLVPDLNEMFQDRGFGSNAEWNETNKSSMTNLVDFETEGSKIILSSPNRFSEKEHWLVVHKNK